MFPPRYYARRHFAGRYYPPAEGGTATVEIEATISLELSLDAALTAQTTGLSGKPIRGRRWRKHPLEIEQEAWEAAQAAALAAPVEAVAAKPLPPELQMPTGALAALVPPPAMSAIDWEAQARAAAALAREAEDEEDIELLLLA